MPNLQKPTIVSFPPESMVFDDVEPPLSRSSVVALPCSFATLPKIMLDILEDYLIASDISYGRIDGDIQGRQRQKVCS